MNFTTNIASLAEEDGDAAVDYFHSFFIQQTQSAAYCKYLINKIKHTSVPTLVDSGKVRRGNKNRLMSAPVSEDTLSQTSSTTTTFSNYKTQDHNSIYTTTCYKSLRTFRQQHLLRSRAKLIPIGLHFGHQQNGCCRKKGGILAM
jgi:hypothetical protein